MWWTGVWWGETLGGQHTGGGSDLSGRGSCPPQEVSTGQGGRWGDVVGGLLSTEEGVNRLRSWRALTPREVWRGAAKGGVVRPRSWTALAPWEVWRCGAKGGVDRPRLWTALAPWEVRKGGIEGGIVKPRSWTALAPQEVWRSVQSQGTADCWVNKNSLRSMLSSKNLQRLYESDPRGQIRAY